MALVTTILTISQLTAPPILWAVFVQVRIETLVIVLNLIAWEYEMSAILSAKIVVWQSKAFLDDFIDEVLQVPVDVYFSWGVQLLQILHSASQCQCVLYMRRLDLLQDLYDFFRTVFFENGVHLIPEFISVDIFHARETDLLQYCLC